jgi:hypothetical protein
VLSGHEHNYERLNIGSLTYFVNGLGGKSIYSFDTVIQSGSQVRYNGNYGAQLVTAYSDSINFKFYNINSSLIDSYTIPYLPIGVVRIGENIPLAFGLSQNYPNPFNPSAKIRFSIPFDAEPHSKVFLHIYDTLGGEIEILVNEELKPGIYEVSWNGSNYPSGVYFYQLTVSSQQLTELYRETKKMVLVK